MSTMTFTNARDFFKCACLNITRLIVNWLDGALLRGSVNHQIQRINKESDCWWKRTANFYSYVCFSRLNFRCYLTKMLIAAVVFASSIILSSAQPSSQCIAAYNATFDTSNPSACVLAYVGLIQGSFTEAERMMVCDVGQQCNAMIENVINICGDTVS